MKSPQLSLEAYETFVAVAKLSSFSKAERILGCTQATISKRVAAMERALGVLLLERRGPRPVSLTEAGKTLMDLVQPLIESFGELPSTLSQRLAGKPRVLSIGCGQTDATRLLPAVVATFGRQYPSVQIQVRVMRSAALLEAIEQDRVQVGLSTRKPGVGSDLMYIPLTESKMVAMVHRNQKLAEQDQIELRRLAGCSLVLPDHDSHARTVIEAAFRKQQLSPRVAVEAGGWEAIRMYAAMGCGVAILPQVHALPAHRDLRELEIVPALPTWTFGLVVRETTLGDPVSHSFVTRLCDALKIKPPAIVSRGMRLL